MFTEGQTGLRTLMTLFTKSNFNSKLNTFLLVYNYHEDYIFMYLLPKEEYGGTRIFLKKLGKNSKED